MDPQLCKYASGFVLLASLAIAGCDNGTSLSTDNLTAPGMATATGSLVTVEPAAVLPEFLSSPFCFAPSIFQARFSLIIRADREVIVSGFGFEFLDRFGVRSVPTSIPIPISSTGAPLIPLPLPSSSPIPIPGTSPFGGLLMSPGSSQTVPFLLQFGCGIPASGTLFVSVNTASRSGVADVKRVTVRIVG
jgi:hypothetical protein